MIPLTFLAAKIPLSKHFALGETRNYPLVKRFTSVEHDVEPSEKGLKEFANYLSLYGNQGYCLYKGQLKRPLVKESRAGMTKTAEPTQLLVIDIDNLNIGINVTKFDKSSLIDLAESLIKELPAELHDVSYVAQASSSLGMKDGKVSLHLFFFMDKAVPAPLLKWWLTSLNLTIEYFSQRLALSPVGHALQYVIDRCMAENSRIIYIAPPTFDKTLSNPFKKDDDRIALVSKSKATAPVSNKITKVAPQAIQALVDDAIKKMRKDANLSDKPARMKMQKVGHNKEENVLTNPDRAVIRYAYHNDVFCYGNLNDGDSNAYYWPLDNPKWVYNFKDEPTFEMAKVDPEFYKWYMEEFREHIVKDANLKPLVFRDFATDAYYTVEYDPVAEQMERFAIASRQSLDDFCSQYWEPLPNPIPTWDVFFDPTGNGGIDLKNNTLNLFTPTKPMQMRIEIPEAHQKVEYGDASEHLQELTPNIYKLMHHMIGGGEVELEHFVNWLAFAFVYRQKTNIAWIMHGIEGTGKGLFYKFVLQELFGKKYTVMKRMQELEDKFDGWREHNLITVVDEFRLSDTTLTSRMYDQIKNMISEPFGTVRYMRANPKEIPLYANYMFFSNNEDAMKLSSTDRRFCLGLRQHVKIDVAYNVPNLIDAVQDELPNFAQFLRTFAIDVNQARVALENQAKLDMRAAANSWVDDFCIALQRGNFTFFLEHVLFFNPVKAEENIMHSKATEAISQWLLDHMRLGTNAINTNVEDLRLIFSLMSGRDTKPAEFGKVLTRRGLVAPRFRHNNKLGRWVTVEFDFADYDPMEIVKEHGTPAQKQEIGLFEKH